MIPYLPYFLLSNNPPLDESNWNQFVPYSKFVKPPTKGRAKKTAQKKQAKRQRRQNRKCKL